MVEKKANSKCLQRFDLLRPTKLISSRDRSSKKKTFCFTRAVKKVFNEKAENEKKKFKTARVAIVCWNVTFWRSQVAATQMEINNFFLFTKCLFAR